MHFELLKGILEDGEKERQKINVARYGTLILVVLLEIISLNILLAKPIPFLIIFYATPLTGVIFVIVLLVANILCFF